MPQLANIVIKDGLAANRTFVPVTSNGTLAKLAERSGANPGLNPTLTVSVREPGQGSSYRIEEKIVMPIAGVVDGVTKQIRKSEVHITYLFSPESTEAERKDLRALAADLTINSTNVVVVEKIEPLY